jgi:hypothetical protein
MDVSRTVTVEAPPERVYAIVSDLPGMGTLSDENVGGRWLGGATGPSVGARFRGSNRNGWRRWSTTVRVEAASPGHEFTFRVGFWGVPVARWSYTLAPAGQQTVVTESWTDRRPWWFKAPAALTTGVGDREASTARSIEHTLAALKRVTEAK